MSGQLIFGDFQLDCLDDTLFKGGETISLTPKALSLLRYLAESGGRLLRKDELLEVVSVAGPRPTLAEIAAATAFSEEAIESRCEHLEKCSVFIRFRGVEEWPDGTMTGGFEFNHALYQNVLYDQLSPLRRMRLHLAMGKRLAQAFQTDHADRLLDMAEHFTQCRDYEHAIDYWRLAAETSLQRQAYHEAATHLDQGLVLLDGIRDSEQRLHLELELRMTLGPVLIAKRGNAMVSGRQDIGGAQIAHGQLPIDHCCKARSRFEIGRVAVS